MKKRTRNPPPIGRRASGADSEPRPERKPDAPPGDARQHGRGRHADKPTDVPTAGWMDVLMRTKNQIGEDNLSIVGAGVAFFAFVAVVPSLIVVIGLYGLIANASDIGSHIAALADVIPNEAMPLLEEQMKRIASTPQAAGISAILGLLMAFYGSSKAMKALIEGLNIAYDEREKRGFIKLNLVALALTLGAIVGAFLAIGLVAVLPSLLERMPLTSTMETLFNWLRWPVLIGGFMAALAVVYRYGASRNEPQWRWVSPGAITAALLWLLGSAAFSFYVSKFGGYDKTYGALGAVVVFLLWLYLTAFVILIGAEVNAEVERQTLKDTTVNPDEPLGERGAEAADTVGPTREELKGSGG